MLENLKIYYKEYTAVFDENFQMVLDNFDVAAIHKMRTSTKRIRALFILLEYLSEKKFKAKKQLESIRSLFKFAGKIREIQIEQLLILQYQESLNEIYPEYIEYLKRREHKEIARFIKHLPEYSKRDRILKDDVFFNSVDKLKEKKVKKLVGKYLKSKRRTVKRLIQKPASNHRIHENRTNLKQVYYLFSILTSLSGVDTIFGFDQDRLRTIEQYFGDWHDLVNSPVYMNAYFKTNGFNKEKKYIDLKNKIASDRKTMRQEITKIYYPEILS